MNLARLLERAARLRPTAPAVLLGTHALHDYADLAARTAALAASLRDALGVRPGDRVAICLPNRPEYLELMHAAWWCGAAVVPINAKLHPQEIAFIARDAGARIAFATPELGAALECACIEPATPEYEKLLEAAPIAPLDRAPQDLAWLFYTSGTTGQPKGVMLSHRNLYAMTACFFTDVDAADPRDVAVYAAPMSHGAGLYSLPYVLKAARHLLPESGGFEPDELIALSRASGRLAMFAAPTMVQRLVTRAAATGDGNGFRTIVYGGGPMYVADLKRALQALGPRFVQIYGQGESPMTITALSRELIADAAHPRWEARIASVGIAQSLVEVRVADEDGRPLPPGETGEVLVRGETVMSGYWGRAQASAEALRGGWLWTGDLGSLDKDGFLTLRDRSKDLIISGGSNIYPREVEEVLLAHPSVREAAVVGAPDREWGETVVAFVVADPALPPQRLEAELDALCLQRIARFKRPRAWRFVEALPKNNYGKVLKTELRRALSDGGSGA